MRSSYIGILETTSRTITALSRFSGRMIGLYDAICAASKCEISLVMEVSRALTPMVVAIISWRMRATPRNCSVDSGLLALKETSSAQVWTSGKTRASISLNVRFSRRLSALDIISATSDT